MHQLHLQSFGAKLRLKDGIFSLVTTDPGNNLKQEQQYAPHEAECILLSRGTTASTDAILLAIERDIPILYLDHFGNVVGHVFPSKPNSTIAIWRQQLLLSQSPEGLKTAKAWIEEKIQNRISFLQELVKWRGKEQIAHINRAVQDMNENRLRLQRFQPNSDLKASAASIRGLEGSASRPYYSTLSALLGPQYQFKGRQYHPAPDLFNACLNYGYAILSSLVTRSLWYAGLNPYIGLMHRDGYQHQSFVFDFIEPYRVWVEETVFSLFSGKKISGQHGYEHPEKGFWLTPPGCRFVAKKLDDVLRAHKLELDQREFFKVNYLAEKARRFSSSLLPRA